MSDREDQRSRLDAAKNSRACLESFLKAFWKDVEAGEVRSLAHYLAHFPECPDNIISEFCTLLAEDHHRDSESETSADESSRKPTRLGTAGSRMAHFTLIREIGRGGQGYVFLARDEKLHRVVALKILHNVQAMDPRTRLRFVREAETASRLAHPGICTIHEFGEYEGMPYISMQYIDGTPLSRMIFAAQQPQDGGEDFFLSLATSLSEHGARQRELPTAPTSSREISAADNREPQSSQSRLQDRAAVMGVVRIIEDVARALHAAHEENLVHRDIKPGNIILAQDGRPVILDFGLARDESSEDAALTQSGDLMGTPAYMSPEQLTHSATRVDRRSDIFSLGVTLFESLTLTRPFSASTRSALYEAIISHDPPDVRKLNPVIPDDVRVIVETALEKDPDRRYQTALEFAEDLRRVREYEPIHARPVGPWVRTLRWVQRNPAVAAAGVVVFLSLLVSSVVFYVKGEEASRQRNRAVAAGKLAQRESEQKSIALKREQAALRAEKQEREAKESALSEKTAALANYERLADLKRLEKAQRASDLLYPPSPELIPRLLEWQRTYGGLAARIQSHREFLQSLRARALPYTEEDRQRDFAEEIAELAKTRESLRELDVKAKVAKNDDARQELAAARKRLHERISDLTQTIAGRRSWDFGDQDTLLFQHDIIAELVTRLETFATDEQGPVKSIEARLKISREIEEKTVKEQADAWALCRERIRNNRLYRGLTLVPQLGLIPLGPDPDSHLEEFLHFLTHRGALPKRDSDGRIAVTENLGIILVLIPGGTFLMGSQNDDPQGPNYDPNGNDDEKPVHEVMLKPYFLSKYEMTQGQWLRSFAHNPSRYGPGLGAGDPRFKAPINLSHPVERVSWLDAQKYLPRIGLVLPTEAEWECGARGGHTENVYGGVSRIDDLRLFANIKGSETRSIGFTSPQEGHRDDYPLHAPVGSCRANGYGLQDMAGNVWEWCLDSFLGYDLKAGDRGMRGPVGSSATRVVRGGSFSYPAMECRVASRNSFSPEGRNYDLGIRPARLVAY